jgi:hypothetical protein
MSRRDPLVLFSIISAPVIVVMNGVFDVWLGEEPRVLRSALAVGVGGVSWLVFKTVWDSFERRKRGRSSPVACGHDDR